MKTFEEEMEMIRKLNIALNGEEEYLAKKEIASEATKSNVNTVCPECGEKRPDDLRVKAGMKCGGCAYGV